MRQRILLALLIGLPCSILADSAERVFFGEIRTGRSEYLSAKKTVSILLSTNSMENIVLYPLGPRGIYGKDDDVIAVRTYVEELSLATADFLNAMKDQQDIEMRLERVALVRDKLMNAGGYGNSCLAGTLTSVLNAHLWSLLNQGQPLRKNLLQHCKVDLKGVLRLVREGAEKDKKNVFFSPDVYEQNHSPRDVLLSLLGKSGEDPVPSRGFGPETWREREPQGYEGMGFRMKSLGDSNSASHVYNWLLLMDEQYAIEVIRAVMMQGGRLGDLEMDEAKARIDAALKGGPEERRYANLRPWDGREVYNYFRKFRHGSLAGASPLETRVRLALETH